VLVEEQVFKTDRMRVTILGLEKGGSWPRATGDPVEARDAEEGLADR